MPRLYRVPLIILIILLGAQGAFAGEAVLIDRELALASPGTSAVVLAPAHEADDKTVCLVAEGRVWPYRWSPPILENQSPFGVDVGRLVPVPFDPQSYLLLNRNGQSYELWHQADHSWSHIVDGDFGARVGALAGGRFAAGEGAGLFAQFESGRIGYWQVAKEGCLPVWQSPEPWPSAAAARQADLDGDGLDELILIGTSGSVTILRWRNGVWENIWTLPPWGQVLGFDLAQTDEQPGLELALVTSQRRLFLISGAAGNYAIKARLTLEMVAAQVALVPGLKGAVLLGDAAGDLCLFTPDADSWRLEARLRSSERLAFLTGLDTERVAAGTISGGLRVIRLVPLGRLSVFYDGTEFKGGGLYWEDGEFYFGPEFLQRVLGISARWDEKKANLNLTWGKLAVSMQADKTEATINGRPWPVGRRMVLVGKAPYVPADLLRSVFLINVTLDPVADWLILTSINGETP